MPTRDEMRAYLVEHKVCSEEENQGCASVESCYLSDVLFRDFPDEVSDIGEKFWDCPKDHLKALRALAAQVRN